MREDYQTLAEEAVRWARQGGADEAEAFIVSSLESTVNVRRGCVEKLIEAGSRSLTVRVFRDHRLGIAHTTDFAPAAVRRTVDAALELAGVAEPDQCAGLPSREELALAPPGDLRLYDESFETLTPEGMKEMALRCEQAAFDFDPRITNSDGAEFSAQRMLVVLANSAGFAASYPATAASLAVEVMADDEDGKKRNDYWYSAERFLHRLEPPEEVGRRAAARAVRKLGARKVGTRQVPVVWEPQMTCALLRTLAEVVSGAALYRRTTLFADLEGQPVGSGRVNVVDDALVPGGLGSRPFDGEGVISRRTAVFEGGVFRSFLFDSYSARRCQRRTTGNGGRAAGAGLQVAPSNLIWEAGDADPGAIVASVEDGLYLTDLMGFGFNPTTGDFSRGAAGIWIERGEPAYPVTEINVSGNLRDMLRDVEMVGSDLLWRANVAAPTVKLSKMTVSGL